MQRLVTKSMYMKKILYYYTVYPYLQYISGRRGICNWGVDHNVAIFSKLSLQLHVDREG